MTSALVVPNNTLSGQTPKYLILRLYHLLSNRNRRVAYQYQVINEYQETAM